MRSDRRDGVSRENLMVSVLAAGGGIGALDAQSVFFLMPFIAPELGLDNRQIALLSSIILLTWALSGFASARLSDRLGRRKPILIGAFLLFALMSGLNGLVTSFGMLLVLRLMMGVAEGPVVPLSQAIVIAESSPHRRGLNAGIVQNLGSQLIGTLIAPIVLVAIAERYGWRPTFLLAALPALAMAVLIHRFISEPVSARSKRSAPRLVPSLRAILASRNVRLCMVMTSCGVAWHFTLMTFVPLWLVGPAGFSRTQMSFVISVIGISGVVSSLVVPGLSDRIGRRTAIAIFTAMGAVAPLGALWSGASMLGASASMAAGFMMLGTFPLLMGTVPLESVPPEHRATASALVVGSGEIIGGLIGPLLGGALADGFGLKAPLLLSAGLAVVCCLVSLLLRRKVDAAVIISPEAC